jgi:archaellum component FlaC
MQLISWKPALNFTYQCLILFLLGSSYLAYAKIPDTTSGKPLTDFVISDNKGTELQLEVRQTPLAQVLDAIAHKTNVIIHYSVLPEGLVTATCVGSTLKHILECLLNRKADIIVRNLSNSAGTNSKLQAAEAWILGTRLASSPSEGSCIASTDTRHSLLLEENKENSEEGSNAEANQTDEIIKRTQSKNPNERVDAIGELLAAGHNGDFSIKAALDKALVDQDANVRAQAISSLSHREGSSANGAIQEALQDISANVRLRAVDGITNNIPMLQQALNDSDEDVRSLASAKLELLTAGNDNKQ